MKPQMTETIPAEADPAKRLLTQAEAAERMELLGRLHGLVRSQSIRQSAGAGSLDDLRGLVTDLEETDALNKKYGRLQAEASPEGW